MPIGLDSRIPTATMMVTDTSLACDASSCSGSSGTSSSSGITATAAVNTYGNVVAYTARAPITGTVMVCSVNTATNGISNTSGASNSSGYTATPGYTGTSGVTETAPVMTTSMAPEHSKETILPVVDIVATKNSTKITNGGAPMFPGMGGNPYTSTPEPTCRIDGIWVTTDYYGRTVFGYSQYGPFTEYDPAGTSEVTGSPKVTGSPNAIDASEADNSKFKNKYKDMSTIEALTYFLLGEYFDTIASNLPDTMVGTAGKYIGKFASKLFAIPQVAVCIEAYMKAETKEDYEKANRELISAIAGFFGPYGLFFDFMVDIGEYSYDKEMEEISNDGFDDMTPEEQTQYWIDRYGNSD